jgi:hypothetical protein
LELLKKYRQQLLSFVIIACGVFLFAEIIRDVQREGDFGGYIEAGKLAWQNTYIYSAHRNTWPPFMSIAAIPLYGLDSVSFYGLRIFWLLGTCFLYWYIFKWTFATFFAKKLRFKLKTTTENEVSLTDSVFLVPFLLSFRIFIEEISNLQVNILILSLCLVAFDFYKKNKTFLSSILLSVLMATKVYPIIILPFLVYKKKFKWLAYTLAGLALTHVAVLLFFGLNGTELYSHWYTKQVGEGLQCIHMNQSLWSLVCGLFSNTSRFQDYFFNITSLQVDQTKLISLFVIALIGLYVAFIFYKNKQAHQALAYQYIIVLSFIPVFSPLAWKCYFVFLVPVTIALYSQLQQTRNLKYLLLPLLIITFSSELFIGNTLSDYAETFGFITLSSLFVSLLATVQLLKQHKT